jgi:hypothetical protein
MVSQEQVHIQGPINGPEWLPTIYFMYLGEGHCFAWHVRVPFLIIAYAITTYAHHSVKIYIRYVNNMITLYHIRHPSGCPLDYT